MIRAILGPAISRVAPRLIDICEEIYLVGGTVRDYLSETPSHDIDFVVKQEALTAARICADQLQGHYYALDVERETGRALVKIDGETVILDFATLAHSELLGDLAQRDFTINAMAINLAEPDKIIDPLHGEQDLKDKVLRPCSPDSFKADPVRTIRAVRFQQKFDLKVDENTVTAIRSAADGLDTISAERKRDELFHIFEIDKVRESYRLLESYSLMDKIFPFLSNLALVDRLPKHVHSLKEHTLQVLDYCQVLLKYVRSGKYESENQFLVRGCKALETYRDNLKTFLAYPIHPRRQYDGLFYLAILYHDVSKADGSDKNVEEGRDIPRHAQRSADLFEKTWTNWALSKDEFLFVKRIIRNHMLPKGINGTEDTDSRKILHRFYKQAGSAGVLIGLFHIADILATYEDTITEERWEQVEITANALLESWFRKYDQIIAPNPLVNGDDLIDQFKLKPGPGVGQLLAQVIEGQAAGEINNKNAAMDFIRKNLHENKKDRS